MLEDIACKAEQRSEAETRGWRPPRGGSLRSAASWTSVAQMDLGEDGERGDLGEDLQRREDLKNHLRRECRPRSRHRLAAGPAQCDGGSVPEGRHFRTSTCLLLAVYGWGG